jgi:hypothetical protein
MLSQVLSYMFWIETRWQFSLVDVTSPRSDSLCQSSFTGSRILLLEPWMYLHIYQCLDYSTWDVRDPLDTDTNTVT